MNRLVLLGALLVAAGCSGVEPRDAMPASEGARLERPVLVRVASEYQPSDPAKPAGGRFAPPIDAEAVAARATALLRERSADARGPAIALVGSVVQANARYVGQTGIFPLKVFFTVFFFPIDFPNYFMSSDRFALTLTARWKLVDEGRVVAEGTAQGKQTGVFGDLTRGWYFVGYLRMPTPLSGAEWEEISAELAPGAQDALAEDLVLETERALAPRKGR